MLVFRGNALMSVLVVVTVPREIIAFNQCVGMLLLESIWLWFLWTTYLQLLTFYVS